MNEKAEGIKENGEKDRKNRISEMERVRKKDNEKEGKEEE
jgi:hypothetical protein